MATITYTGHHLDGSRCPHTIDPADVAAALAEVRRLDQLDSSQPVTPPTVRCSAGIALGRVETYIDVPAETGEGS